MEIVVELVPGEDFRFHVTSKSRANLRHLVDLESYRWNGECSCEAFTMNHRKFLEAGGKAADITRCSHIKATRSFFLSDILPKLADALRGARLPKCQHGAFDFNHCDRCSPKPAGQPTAQEMLNDLMLQRMMIDRQINELTGHE